MAIRGTIFVVCRQKPAGSLGGHPSDEPCRTPTRIPSVESLKKIAPGIV